MTTRQSSDPFILRLQGAIKARKALMSRTRTKGDVATVEADDATPPEQVSVSEPQELEFRITSS